MSSRKTISKTKLTTSVASRLAERIKERADEEKRDVSSLVSYLLERSMEEWEPTPEEEITENYKQLQEYVKLLTGDRPRNGLSFSEIADITGLSARQVEELYLLVETCRKNTAAKTK